MWLWMVWEGEAITAAFKRKLAQVSTQPTINQIEELGLQWIEASLVPKEDCEWLANKSFYREKEWQEPIDGKGQQIK